MANRIPKYDVKNAVQLLHQGLRRGANETMSGWNPRQLRFKTWSPREYMISNRTWHVKAQRIIFTLARYRSIFLWFFWLLDYLRVLSFFSAGFKTWKEHISDSSTLIIAPALSNSPLWGEGSKKIERWDRGQCTSEHKCNMQKQQRIYDSEDIPVIWCRKDRDESSLGKELVTILNDLVGSADKIQIMFFQELRHNIRAECEGHTTIVLTPAFQLLIRIGPQKIANDARIRDICGTHESANLIHGVMFGRETAVHAEDLLVHNGGDR